MLQVMLAFPRRARLRVLDLVSQCDSRKLPGYVAIHPAYARKLGRHRAVLVVRRARPPVPDE